MDQAETIKKLNEEHRNLLMLVQPFGKSDFETTGVADEWTVKDVFAHVAFWNWEAQKSVEQVMRGERPVMMLDVDFDAINARELEQTRKQTLYKVMDDFRRSQIALVELLQRMSETEFVKVTHTRAETTKTPTLRGSSAGLWSIIRSITKP